MRLRRTSRIAEIDLRLVELKEMRRLLERLTAKCNAEASVSQCAILAALHNPVALDKQ